MAGSLRSGCQRSPKQKERNSGKVRTDGRPLIAPAPPPPAHTHTHTTHTHTHTLLRHSQRRSTQEPLPARGRALLVSGLCELYADEARGQKPLSPYTYKPPGLICWGGYRLCSPNSHVPSLATLIGSVVPRSKFGNSYRLRGPPVRNKAHDSKCTDMARYRTHDGTPRLYLRLPV